MHLMQSAPGPETVVDGQKYLYFCGTGYLGLHGHPEVIRAACQATEKLGMGTATNRAGFGNAEPTIDVEQLAARFWRGDDGFFFASGYLGNHVLLSVLAPSADAVFLDEHSHYSVVDACRFFDLPVHRFAHRDAQALREALQIHLRPGRIPIVMSDGVFAARGSIAPVTDYLSVLQDYDRAMLCLDDCHGYGVLGRKGRGTCEHFGDIESVINAMPDESVDSSVPRLYAAGTLSKAFGAYGGIVVGTDSFIESVKIHSHYYCAASAPPIPVAAAGAAAIGLVMENPVLVARVQRNAQLLKQKLATLGLDVDGTPVPIVSLVLGDQKNMQRMQRELSAEGILIAYSEKYSGLGEHGAIRIATFATHTDEMIETLCESIGRHL